MTENRVTPAVERHLVWCVVHSRHWPYGKLAVYAVLSTHFSSFWHQIHSSWVQLRHEVNCEQLLGQTTGSCATKSACSNSIVHCLTNSQCIFSLNTLEIIWILIISGHIFDLLGITSLVCIALIYTKFSLGTSQIVWG